MLVLYGRDETDFSGNGAAVLEKAVDVHYVHIVNGDYTLHFGYPLNDPKALLIKEYMIVVCCGQAYRVSVLEYSKKGVEMLLVTAVHVYADNENYHIRRIDNLIGVSAQVVFGAAFSGTCFHVLNAGEISALGMTPMTKLTDFFEVSKITPDKAVKMLIENIGEGEIYRDNWRVGLVSRIGRDAGLTLRPQHNLKSVKREENPFDVVTRLVPYGKNDMPITSVAGRDYIDSPNIALYGVKEGTRTYSHIDDAQMLLARAQFEFSAANPERIDVVPVTYEAEIIDTGTEIGIGDDVRLEGAARRIIKLDKYPYEPINTTAVIGRVKKDLFFYIKKMKDYDYEPPDINLEEITEAVSETVIDNSSTVINNAVLEVFKTDVLSAGTAMINVAWIRDLWVEWLETNFSAIDPRRNYPSGGRRYYIRIYNQHIEFREAVLSQTEVVDFKLPTGEQIYWTAVSEDDGAYQYFTITDPILWNNDIQKVTAENVGEFSYNGESYAAVSELYEAYREVYRVKVRRTLEDYPRKTEAFVLKNGVTIPVDTYGIGDLDGNGVGSIYKTVNGMYFTYTKREGEDAGFEYGIKITDDGYFWHDLRTGDWFPLEKPHHYVRKIKPKDSFGEEGDIAFVPRKLNDEDIVVDEDAEAEEDDDL
ncbi:hypothetical protein AGMMS49975_17260 [Clostridia bacterium]|nr:hypothetical protein AGMMS49975_17260 [Clostridia bacterium]